MNTVGIKGSFTCILCDQSCVSIYTETCLLMRS